MGDYANPGVLVETDWLEQHLNDDADTGDPELERDELELVQQTHYPALAELSQYDSVALFVDRARAAVPSFAITNENAPAVAACPVSPTTPGSSNASHAAASTVPRSTRRPDVRLLVPGATLPPA